MAEFRRAVAAEPAHLERRDAIRANATMIDPKSQACARKGERRIYGDNRATPAAALDV
jgi:hypothetical protein